MLNKIIKSFEEIDDYDIMQNCIWILSYYSNDLEMLKKVFDLIMKNLGDLNFEFSSNENSNNNEEKPKTNEKKTITKTVVLPDGTYGTVTQVVNTKEINKNKENKFLRKFILESNYYFSANLVSALTGIIFKMKKLNFDKFKIYYYNTINIICSILKLNSDVIIKDEDNTNHIKTCLKILLSNDESIIEEFNNEYKNLELNDNSNNNKISSEIPENKTKIVNPDEPLHFRHTRIYDPDNFDVDDEEETQTSSNSSISVKKPSKFIEILTGTEDPLFIECEIEIFTFDLSLNFFIKNKTSNSFQNVTLNLFVPNEFSIIEKPPIFSIEPNENVSVHCTVKFSKTINAYIYGQINFNNFKGENTSINLSGLFIELLNTFPENISDIQFRKKWIEYSWEHNVMLVSRKKSFKSIVENLVANLKMTLVFPKNVDDINENEPFMVANLYSKTKLGEDALINVSVEKTKDKKIIGTCVLRSKAKEFMMSLGEKIKAISY
jgi:coatomer subunit beta